MITDLIPSFQPFMTASTELGRDNLVGEWAVTVLSCAGHTQLSQAVSLVSESFILCFDKVFMFY
jgi:hypothetical protein